MPRIGEYHRWAIQWGYTWMPLYGGGEGKKAALNRLVISRESKNPPLWCGPELDDSDPRCQNEDLSDNAMKAGRYGILNLQRIVPRLLEWTR